MFTLLSALHDLLSFITEDAKAHGLTKDVPIELRNLMNELCIKLGEYLDKNS